jgi:hypothetical protein
MQDPTNNPATNLVLSVETWTHYLYKIEFVDGYFYSGVSKRKGDSPLHDGYFGSPTDSSKWHETMYKKVIIAYLWVSSQEEAFSEETQWQKANFKIHDPMCLNKHFGRTNFSKESSSKGGYNSGMKSHVSGRLREMSRLGGLKAVSSGQLAKARELSRKSEKTKEAWRKIGRRNALSGHLARIGKLGGKRNVESGHMAKLVEMCKKPVELTNISTGEVKVYPSIVSAANSVGAHQSNLSSLLAGRGKSCNGHTARFV